MKKSYVTRSFKIFMVAILVLVGNFVFAQPAITSFTPATGPVGTLVTITGANLNNPTALTIGGVAAIQVSNDGSTLVAMIMPGATTGVISVTTAGGTESSLTNFTINTIPQPNYQSSTKLIGTVRGTNTNATQGSSVAISADGNTAVVGSRQDENSLGAFYIYIKNGSVWSQQGPKYVPSDYINLGSIVYIGSSVAISGDGNTVLVGANFDNNGKGAGWIYTRTGTTWTQQAKLIGSTPAGSQPATGSSAALSIDGQTAILGAPGDNSNGAFYVFKNTANVWAQEGPKYTITDNVGYSGFGGAIALSADQKTLAISGRSDNNGTGATWIFTSSGGTWTQEAKLTALDAATNAFFGSSVALSADGNTLLAGAQGADTNLGAGYIFTRAGVTWTQHTKFAGTGSVPNSGVVYQGQSSAIDASGNNAFIAGQWDSARGAIWAFTKTGNTWNQVGNKFTTLASPFTSYMGNSISLTTDGATLFAGASGDNSSAGAAFAFSYIPPPTVANGITTLVVTNSATLNATGNPNGLTATGSFTYGTDPALAGGTTTATTALGAGTSPVAFSRTITGLTPGTTYYYRANATNTIGTTNGSPILSFTTLYTPPGNALALDGTDDRAITTETAAFNFGTGNFTLEAWVNTSNNSPFDFVALGNSSGSGEEYWIGMRSLRPQFTVSGVGIYGTANLNDGKWHHLAGVRYAGEMYLYVDGVLQNATPNTNSASPNAGLTIGALSNNTSNWIGLVDEARVYNTNLTLAQIQADIKNTSAALPGNLVAHYHLDYGTAGANNAGITTIYDQSANGYNAVLSGTALTGSASNFVMSYAMVVPTATNASSITNSSFTASWTAPSIGTATSYRLDVSTSPDFTTLLSSYNNLTVNGLSQLVTNLMPGTTYYFRVRAVGIAGEGGNSNRITATTTALTAPGNAFLFDGVDDAINIPDNTALQPAILTVEAWIKPLNNANKPIIKKINSRGGLSGNATFNIAQNAGKFITSMASAGGAIATASQAGTYTIGKWHHVAAIYTATNVRLYVDGVLQQTLATGFPIDYAATPITIGGEVNAANYANAAIDEVKIWSTDRSANLAADMTTVASASAPGLIAYYNFDHGSASGSNAGVTTLYDQTANGLNGTISNAALTGATSNWVSSYALVAPVANSATAMTHSSFTANWTASQTGSANNYRLDVATDANFTNFATGYNNILVAGTSQTVRNIAPGTTYYYRVRAERTTPADISGNSAVITTATTSLSPPGNSLSFDGIDDYLTVVQSPEITGLGAGSFTAEAWVKPGNMDDLSIFRKTGDYNLLIYNGKLYAEVWTTLNSASSYQLIVGTKLIPINKWTHVAFVKTGTNYTFYIDGEPDASTVTPGNIAAVENLQIGISAAFGNPFNGAMDELRLWNVARTQSEINLGRTSTVSPSATGLVLYYDFDHGTSNGTNTGFTTIYDKSPTGTNGTLQTFALTGTNSNFTASYALVVPVAAAPTNITSTSITANWTAPLIGTADGYRLDLSTNADFTTFVAGYNNLQVNATTLMLTGLVPATTYYYRIRAFNTIQATSGGASTITSVATLSATTPPGNALAFDGVDDHLTFDNRPVIFDSTPFTIEAWIKTTGNTMGIISHANDNSNWEAGEKAFYINPDGTPAFVGYASDYIYSGIAVNDGYWHHVSVTYSGAAGSGKIYVDGINRTTTSNYHPSGTEIGNFYIGRPNFSAGEATNYFNGSLDDVRIWNTERSSSEITSDMMAVIAGNTSGLVFSFDMNQGKTNGDNTLITRVKNNSYFQDPGVLNNFSLTTGNTTSNFVGPVDYATLPPTAPFAANITETQFTATWTPPVGETISSYFLDVATDAAFTTFVPGYNNLDIGRVFDHQVTGLSAGNNYYFRVRTYSIYLGASPSSTAALVSTQTSVTSIARATDQLTNTVFVNYTVKFAHPVTGLNANNFDLNPIGISGAYINSIAGSGTTYTVNVGTGGGDGSLGLSLANSTGIVPGISNSLPFAGESYTIDKTAPVTPANLAAVSGDTQNIITWTGNAEADLKQYNLYSGSGSGGGTIIATLTAGINTFTHTGLTNGTQYFYYIEAIDNATNVSTPGNVIYQTPRANQTITFAAADSKVYGTADYNPGATSGSSGVNTIVYTSSNPAVAMVFSGTIHIFNAGTTTITASQSGSDAYNAAPDVTQTLSITPKPIAVTADAKAKIYGSADPALTYTYTPALVGFDGFSGALSRDSGENTGNFAIHQGTLTLSPNYAITYTPANLNINPKPVTVTAEANTKVYGTADPVFTYSVAPALETGDAFTGALARTANENVGSFAINLGSLALNSNYTLAYAPANLTITAKPVTVTADAKTKVYGTADPAFTYSVAPALVAGDAFTGSLSRASGENTGVYAIGKNTLALSNNYTLTYAPANLTITAKPVTVSADAKTKVYGTADPVFTYTVAPALVTGDAFTGSLSRASGENVGAYAIGKNTLALSNNYTLTYAPSNLTITAKPVTVIADTKTKVYGTADPAFTYTVAPALVTGDTFTGTLSRASGENTGVYAIGKNTLELSNNYTLTYAPANLTVTAKALVITADNKSRQQGVANPPFTAGYAGFVNGETSAVLTTQPALSTTATAASPQGNYPINAGGAAAQNYSISYIAGTLSVTPGNVTGTTFTATALYENMPANTSAGTLSATSDDPNASFTYTLVTGTGNTDNALFSIFGNQVLTTGSLDFENKSVYSIRVRTTTQFGLSAEQVIVINLSDVNEIPTLTQIAPQVVCYTSATQSVVLSGISAGPDASQTVVLTATSNNANLFSSLSITAGNAGVGILNYTIKPGATGNATITVTVKDNGGIANGGVDTFTRTFTITVNALPVITVTSDKGSNQLSLGATAVLTATGGVSYQWTNASGIVSGQSTASLTVKPLFTTTYTVTGTNASGCTTTTSFTINVLSDFRMLEETNIITPNGDGVNDNWVIKNIELYPNNEVTVFDRAGRIVFNAKNYKNTWNATINGAPLSEGTYYYLLDFGDEKGKRKGFITIVRNK